MKRINAVVEPNLFHSYFERNSSSILHVIFLTALCGVLYFPYLGRIPFFDKGEPREALTVQDIVERGDWLVPLKRGTDIPSKPPLFHWSGALTSQLAGKLNEATIRLPSALYATVGVLLLYALGRKLFDPRVAVLGGAILATTLVYQKQALSARVDMTLCFFVTLSLVLFYSLYRGFLTSQVWYYTFYAVTGIGTLAKGPLGILLPALVAGVFVVLKKRWDLLAKFCFHPGVALMLILGAGWYAIAVRRGGEGFFDRQILQENLSRFTGGSGHNHPFYYYIPYLFAEGLPWSLFLPFLLWDSFTKGYLSEEDSLFLKLWFLVIFVFFSLSMGKGSVYLLPVYPAMSLLTAVWLYNHEVTPSRGLFFYRLLAVIGAVVGVVLVIVTAGAMWNHDSGWFFSPIEQLLKAKDRANLLTVKSSLATFGWSFTIVSLVASMLWLSLAHCLWRGRLWSGAQPLVLISVVLAFVARVVVMPVIADAKSYRSFIEEVNRRVKPGNKFYLYGYSFNSDAVVFYRGGRIETLDQPPEAIAAKIGPGNAYIIMAEQVWVEIQNHTQNLPTLLLKSRGAGPEGDTPLVLVRGSVLSDSNKEMPAGPVPREKKETVLR